MNRADRRAQLRGKFKVVQEAKRIEQRALRMTPAQARELLARWAAKQGRTQAEVDAMNGRSDG
jgi:hypothetical protein